MAHRLARVLVALICAALTFAGFIDPPRPAQADTGTNWTGVYYANPSLQEPSVFTRIDPAVVFNWGPNPPGPGLGSQYWSARWTTIQFLNAGTYRFTVTSDDGVRVYINGQIILDQWKDQAPTTYNVNVQVSTGNYAIQVDYYQGVGDASIAVSWQFVQTQSTAWTAQYFNNPNLQGPPVMTRLEPQINWWWGRGSPDPFVFPDYFSARWTATLPFNAATYRFTLYGDDGVRLFIDDIRVIDQWKIQNLTGYSIDVPLSAGLHTLRVEYFEATENAGVRLNYEIAVGPPPFPGSQSDQWYAEYFLNPNLSGSPALIRYEGQSGIRFLNPPPGFPRENFSVRWTRRACTPGRPTVFYLTTDDGARFFIDSTLIIDQWRIQSATSYRQNVDLTAGCHTFRLEYFQASGQSILDLTWDPPDAQVPPQYPGGQPPPVGGNVIAVVSNASVLNVRTGPGVNYNVISQVRRNDVLVLSQRNADTSWVRASTATGVNGWVSARYITVTAGNINSLPIFGVPTQPGQPPGPTGVRGLLTSGLRLRSGPGTIYPQIGLLAQGSVVDIVGRSRDSQWLQVRYGSAAGWIYAPYVLIVSGSLVNVPITG